MGGLLDYGPGRVVGLEIDVRRRMRLGLFVMTGRGSPVPRLWLVPLMILGPHVGPDDRGPLLRLSVVNDDSERRLRQRHRQTGHGALRLKALKGTR